MVSLYEVRNVALYEGKTYIAGKLERMRIGRRFFDVHVWKNKRNLIDWTKEKDWEWVSTWKRISSWYGFEGSEAEVFRNSWSFAKQAEVGNKMLIR